MDPNYTNETKTLHNFIYEFMMNNYDTETDSRNASLLDWIDGIERDSLLHHARQFYSYCTPLILILGLSGNVLSLCVFGVSRPVPI